MSPEIKRGPINPIEAAELKTTEIIPEEVFGAFNELIAQNLQGKSSRVLQKEIVKRLKDDGMKESEIFEKHWLDVEGSYREVGWEVKYDKPVYYAGENFEPYFLFTAK